jgi:hypothetical protein
MNRKLDKVNEKTCCSITIKKAGCDGSDLIFDYLLRHYNSGEERRERNHWAE